MGYRFTGIVSDGGTGIVGAVDKVFSHIPYQICLAHLHRGIIAAIDRYPRDEKVKDLKRLADHVWFIESKEALRWWREQLNFLTIHSCRKPLMNLRHNSDISEKDGFPIGE